MGHGWSVDQLYLCPTILGVHRNGETMKQYSNWIVTSEGKEFEFGNPDLDIITIEDIAESLAKECRFTGKCRGFYSVAQHSVLVSQNVPPHLAMEGLLHDAGEAYCKDLSYPLKAMLPEYKVVEAMVESAVRSKFGLSQIKNPEIKKVDTRMLATEVRDLMPKHARHWLALPEGTQPFDFHISPMEWWTAKTWFLERYRDLKRRGL